MKKHLLPLCLLVAVVGANAQSDQFAYAVTDVNKDGANWSFLRKLDLQSGTFSDVLLTGNDANRLAFDAASKKQMTTPLNDERFGTIANAAFGTGVAAIAYDRRHNRLYYTPMFFDQLRYIDLKTMNVFFVNGQPLTGMSIKNTDQSNIVTRMVIAGDGNGYALTNDGNHLIRFTTGKTTQITNLGSLVDDPANGEVSIHNSCTSFGGDMIADDDDNVYVFSARNHVFRINLNSKVATHLGSVSGLPANFTVNGAAVSGENEIVISSAVDNSTLFVVNTETWEATPRKAGPWKGSDLANSNLLAGRIETISRVIGDAGNESQQIRVFPNPVTQKQFSAQFNIDPGTYTVQLLDVAGRQTASNVVNINVKGQTENVQVPASSKKGVYLVKVLDNQSRTVFSKKLLVQ